MHESAMLRTRLLAVAIAVTLLSAPGFAGDAPASEGKHWSYSGDTGPEHWGELNPDYASCSQGKQQSPINIGQVPPSKLSEIQFNYQPSALAVINNGHTIQVNYDPGSGILVDGKTYDLVQFHFHHLSETTLDGKHSPLEVHLVHKNKDGSLAVVAVLFEEGRANPAIKTVWSNLPNEEGNEDKPGGVQVKALQLLPAKHNYYTFRGSLTTPPCSEGVTWLVLAHKMTASKEQIAAFAALYRDNYRPVQPLNGRTVMYSGK